MAALPPPLKIAVLGAGKIGSAFAFQLAGTGGHDVTVIARPNSLRLAQLERDRAVIDVRGRSVPVSVTSRLDARTPYDLLVITLLAHQVQPLLPTLQRSAARAVLCMFNTFRPERLITILGADRCALGMPFVQSMLDPQGRLKVTIGAMGQKTLLDQQRWVNVFTTCGLPAALESEMQQWLRCHAPLCVAFESVSAAAELRGGGASWKEAMVLADGVKVCFQLIRNLGHPIYPRSKVRIDASPTWRFAGVLWFMSRVRPFRELLATGKVEARELVRAMLDVAPPGFDPSALSRIRRMPPGPDA